MNKISIKLRRNKKGFVPSHKIFYPSAYYCRVKLRKVHSQSNFILCPLFIVNTI